MPSDMLITAGLAALAGAGIAHADALQVVSRQPGLYAFYGDDQGDNYAQSRYLLQYLQERGLLRTYYHAFHASRRTDPTGYDTLRAILRVDDMDQFQAGWEKWALGLEYQR